MTSATRKLFVVMAAASLAACEFDTAGVYFPGGDDLTGPDSGLERPAYDPEGAGFGPGPICAEWHSRHFDPCEIPKPNGGLGLHAAGTHLLDTDNGMLTDPLGGGITPASIVIAQANGPAVRVLSVDELVVGAQATLRVIGSAPLIVASWSTIEVAGAIDVSSTTTSGRGAGSGPEACQVQAPTQGGDSLFSGGGGGGGAGFGSAGGRGGSGAFGAGGEGGAAVAVPVVVRGGCTGASGGAGRSLGGEGGSGGGAIHLAARRQVTVYGVVVANGSGGRRGDRALFGGDGPDHDANSGAGGGGGGGGSGGMIGLEAPTVVLGTNAVVAANGGGAGEGGDTADWGAPGSDGLAESREAPGGAGFALQGGDGGSGGFALAPPGNLGGIALLGGGGGGGGGVGFVVLDADNWLIAVTAVVTPAPTEP